MSQKAFLDFIRLIVDVRLEEVARQLRLNPTLAVTSLEIGATRSNASEFFFPTIRHYMYRGDTALHVAAAAASLEIVQLLTMAGANCRARNRRGAEPLHYGCDGSFKDSQTPATVIEHLVASGADANAFDRSGVAPLHRAVRSRCLEAVTALLNAGADVRLRNKSGSTPLHLAVQSTGASGSGSETAKRQQKLIIQLLLNRGARLTDEDSRGRTAYQSASCRWIQSWFADMESGLSKEESP